MPSEVEDWVDEGKCDMENALRTQPEDMREQYQRQNAGSTHSKSNACIATYSRACRMPAGCWWLD